MASKLRMTVNMHIIHTHARFDDLDLDFKNVSKARPFCSTSFCQESGFVYGGTGLLADSFLGQYVSILESNTEDQFNTE